MLGRAVKGSLCGSEKKPMKKCEFKEFCKEGNRTWCDDLEILEKSMTYCVVRLSIIETALKIDKSDY